MQQTEKYWNLINRIVIVAILAMTVIGATLLFAPKVQQMQMYKERLASKQRSCKLQREISNEFAKKSRRLNTDREFAERVAHEIGYAKPNEIIFHFQEDTNSH